MMTHTGTHKSVLALLITGALSTAATAVHAGELPVYLGFGIGQSVVDASARDTDALWLSQGLTTQTSISDWDTAWKLFAGYGLTANFAVEATYMNYGTVSADSTVTAPAPGLATIDTDIDAWIVDAVGIVPVSDRVELFGKLGMAMWSSDSSGSSVVGATATSYSSDDSGSDLHFGFGIGYGVASNIGISAEWERVNADDNLDAWTISTQIGF